MSVYRKVESSKVNGSRTSTSTIIAALAAGVESEDHNIMTPLQASINMGSSHIPSLDGAQSTATTQSHNQNGNSNLQPADPYGNPTSLLKVYPIMTHAPTGKSE